MMLDYGLLGNLLRVRVSLVVRAGVYSVVRVFGVYA